MEDWKSPRKVIEEQHALDAQYIAGQRAAQNDILDYGLEAAMDTFVAFAELHDVEPDSMNLAWCEGYYAAVANG